METTAIHSAAGLAARVDRHRPAVPQPPPHRQRRRPRGRRRHPPPRRGEPGPQRRPVPGRAARSSAATCSRPCGSRSRRAGHRSPASRASVRLPARFQLVAAMNPCPCGRAGDGAGACRCTPAAGPRLPGSRISGPLLDRIDLQVEVPALDLRRDDRARRGALEGRARPRGWRAARMRQAARANRRRESLTNARLEPSGGAHRLAALDADGAAPARGGRRALPAERPGDDRLLRVARTLADLDGS